MKYPLAALLPLFCTAAWTQASEQTQVLALAHIESGSGMQEFVNTLHAIVEIRDVTTDAAARTVTVSTTADRIALASLLLNELDRPEGTHPAAFAVYDSVLQDPRNPTVKVLYAPHVTTPQQIQEMVNAVRSLAEVQRITAFTGAGALVLRSTPEQAEFAEWLVREFDSAASAAAPPNTSQYTYPDTAQPHPERRATAIRIYHPVNIHMPVDTQEAVNALRSIADLQRVVALSAGPAIALRGSDSQVAVADWLMGELDRRSPSGTGHEYQAPSLNGEVVRTFFPKPGTMQDLLSAVRSVRQSTGIQRIVVCQRSGAVVLRGAAGQVATAITMLQ